MIEYVLIRLGAKTYEEICVQYNNSINFSEKFFSTLNQTNDSRGLNEMCIAIAKCGSHNTKKLEAVVEYTQPETIYEIKSIAKRLYAFEFFEGMQNLEQYGKKFIGNRLPHTLPYLEKYIDYEGYASEIISESNGYSFTTTGLVICYDDLNQIMGRDKENTMQMDEMI